MPSTAPFQIDATTKPRMFCVNYSKPLATLKNYRPEEEIYSSLKKVRDSDSMISANNHVTMIPLGSPRELQREATNNGTLIRITSATATTTNPNEMKPMKELIPKMRQQKDFESWSGRAMEGRVVNGSSSRHTNPIRGYWQRNIEIEQKMRADDEKRRQRPKSYGFPKWRSTDALSASLIASNCVQIPVDSRIPEERLKKMEETQREAVVVQKEIQEEATIFSGGSNSRLSKGKSLDSLNMQVDYKPWYDSEQIKSAVSRESIANIATSREFFENASQRDWRSVSNSRRDSVCSLSIAPPLPPKSDMIQMRQAAAVQMPANQQSHPIANHEEYGISKFGDKHSQSQTSINRLIQQDSPQIADPIEQQEVLLMLYLKQNMDIVQGLGIQIPTDLLSEMDDLQLLPVELRIIDEDVVAPSPATATLFSPPSMRNVGRYQRKPQLQLAPQFGGSRQSIASKFGNKKADFALNNSIRSRQNSEMTNSNFDIFSQASYNNQQSANYGYHN